MADHNKMLVLKLSQQVKTLETIDTILDSELSAISAKRGDGLKEIAQEKTACLESLMAVDKEIGTLVNQNELNTDEVSQLISTVNQKLKECQQKNEINAHAAHQAQLSVKQLKNILIGAPTSMTYNQSGGVSQGNSELVRNLKA